MYFESLDVEDYNKYCQTLLSPNVYFTFPYNKTHVIYTVDDHYV